MAITDPLLLPDDVVLMPVADLPVYLREQLDYEDGDYVITRSRSRTNSRIIDAQTAELLRLFQTPTLVVQAAIRFGKAHRLDPEQVLVDAFPLLQSFMEVSFLVEANSQQTQSLLPSLATGELFVGCEVLQCIHILVDTEVYQARHANGKVVALKVSRSGHEQATRRMFEREIAILKHLDNQVNPALLDSGMCGDQYFLILEWCPGVQVSVAADELRRRGPDNRQLLLHLCCAVLDAYSHLHAQGIIHADIHPGNILVTHDGSVRIIDYGFACREGIESKSDVLYRADVSYFSAPEYAQAALSGPDLPLPDMQEEQFSLAVLLYQLLTGTQYLKFSFERAEVLQQIVTARPLPFASWGVRSWFAVETLLARALRKHPAERFPSVSAFARELRKVTMQEERPVSSLILPSANAGAQAAQALLRDMLQHLGLESPLLASGLTMAPTCSLSHGAAGVAYALYRIACVQNSASLLSLADLWSTQAIHNIDSSTAFYDEEAITPEAVGSISPYHTACGVYCVQALISHAMGDFVAQERAINAFIAASQAPCENRDLTLGRAGTLLASAFLLDSLSQSGMLDASPLQDFGNEIMQHIWDEINAFPVIQQCSAITYLGMAHGWAGLLYATLRWCQSSRTPFPSMLEERLQQLSACSECYGRGARWPVVIPLPVQKRSAEYLSGWCNGSAGYIHLWTLAHSVFGDELYGRLAEQAAWHAWESKKVLSSLCCGLAGQSYGLLNLYKYTGEKAWLIRAQELVQQAALNRSGAMHLGSTQLISLDIPGESLYQGDLGLVVLIAELTRPEDAAMPFFEKG